MTIGIITRSRGPLQDRHRTAALGIRTRPWGRPQTRGTVARLSESLLNRWDCRWTLAIISGPSGSLLDSRSHPKSVGIFAGRLESPQDRRDCRWTLGIITSLSGSPQDRRGRHWTLGINPGPSGSLLGSRYQHQTLEIVPRSSVLSMDLQHGI
ncbi:hypothetical protein PSTG_14741 [Puccinia striiformis f. sp. tritici PST-78]|uniref:Uncharacterized protein n=1 Tax=Puccinia striiformis f. sp. tritici PST-78 TaxID=1165861 RepID=A0A0L0UXT5_9BASI|nr:hypothetical protein PSTG_14741 [Puccinia striiformis f. sp. tritici PST-78]